ncbi:MAG: hypothetical protein OXC91_00630 [Rhodobacteraceae bacterium]|nr:hypothetical protein [Paracoccaceae bacterium]
MPCLDTRARQILRQNDRGGYTVPSDRLYPYQWNWDSAFAAIGFAEFDLDRAWTEIKTLLSGQWDNGMVPHILFHQQDDGYFPGPDIWGCNARIPSSGISQPPVLTTVVRKIWEQDPERGAPTLERIYPQLVNWHRWFISWRLDDAGAVCITHPWEAGRDNAPDWDDALGEISTDSVNGYERRDTNVVDAGMRPTKFDYDRYIWLVELGRRHGWDQTALIDASPFRMADPTMTFILLRANCDLVAIGRALGHDIAEIEEWASCLEAGANSLWNPDLEAFDSRNVHSGAWSGCLSNASFLCWYGGIDRPRMHEHFDRLTKRVAYIIPSHDPDSSRFDRQRYWRGPVWPMMNTLIAIGLEESGYTASAEILRRSTARLIERSGFSEYYDPEDGTPAGGVNFTWTAAIWLSWASSRTGREQWARLN